MADRTSGSIRIAASPAQVMAVISDFPRYPEWVNAAQTVEVLATDNAGRAQIVRFNLDAGMVREEFDLAYTWAPDGRAVSWQLLRGELQKAQFGAYTLTDHPEGGTLVTYELTVDLNVPMIGQFKRKAEKVITDTALDELKKRVEA